MQDVFFGATNLKLELQAMNVVEYRAKAQEIVFPYKNTTCSIPDSKEMSSWCITARLGAK